MTMKQRRRRRRREQQQQQLQQLQQLQQQQKLRCTNRTSFTQGHTGVTHRGNNVPELARVGLPVRLDAAVAIGCRGSGPPSSRPRLNRGLMPVTRFVVVLDGPAEAAYFVFFFACAAQKSKRTGKRRSEGDVILCQLETRDGQVMWGDRPPRPKVVQMPTKTDTDNLRSSSFSLVASEARFHSTGYCCWCWGWCWCCWCCCCCALAACVPSFSPQKQHGSLLVIAKTFASPASFAPGPICAAPLPVDHSEAFAVGSQRALLGVLLVEIRLQRGSWSKRRRARGDRCIEERNKRSVVGEARERGREKRRAEKEPSRTGGGKKHRESGDRGSDESKRSIEEGKKKHRGAKKRGGGEGGGGGPRGSGDRRSDERNRSVEERKKKPRGAGADSKRAAGQGRTELAILFFTCLRSRGTW